MRRVFVQPFVPINRERVKEESRIGKEGKLNESYCGVGLKREKGVKNGDGVGV